MSSTIGTTIEYYDHFIFGVAASLVFGRLFYGGATPFVGTVLALSTFALAWVVRPLGAVVFGHLGDRIGRKRTVVITLLLMGVSTMSIGLLPSYDQVGALAPILLVVARLVQGFSLGGETTGAFLVSVENAPDHRRGLFGAIVQAGSGLGLFLATLVFIPVQQLPPDQLDSWGWRVPFLLSAVLVGVGLYIRRRLDESTEFVAADSERKVEKFPVAAAFRDHGVRMVLVMFAKLTAGVTFYVATVFALSYGTAELGVDGTTMLNLTLLMTVVVVVAGPLTGVLADRWGRREVFLWSAVALVVIPWVWFLLLDTAAVGPMAIGFTLLALAYTANSAVLPSYFSLVFPVAVRYSGLGLAFAIGALFAGGLAPLISTTLLQAFGGWAAIAVYMSIAAVLSVVATIFLHEYREDPAAPAPGDQADALTPAPRPAPRGR